VLQHPVQFGQHRLRGTGGIGAGAGRCGFQRFGTPGQVESADAPGAVQAMLAELDRVLQHVQAYLASTSPATDADDTPALSRADHQRLQAMLEGGDFEAIDEVRRLTGRLRHQHAQAAREIETAVSAFDFERALAALGRIPTAQ
jgi:hypothetical protein